MPTVAASCVLVISLSVKAFEMYLPNGVSFLPVIAFLLSAGLYYFAVRLFEHPKADGSEAVQLPVIIHYSVVITVKSGLCFINPVLCQSGPDRIFTDYFHLRNSSSYGFPPLHAV
nr:MAG TPA: hypothetical protein [Caudoviricetes sp.]